MAIKSWLRAGFLLTFILFGAAASADNCYLLKDAKGKILHNSNIPPFDLSYPPFSGEYQASRAKGEQLIILPDTDCYREEEFSQQLSYVKQIAAYMASRQSKAYETDAYASRWPMNQARRYPATPSVIDSSGSQPIYYRQGILDSPEVGHRNHSHAPYRFQRHEEPNIGRPVMNGFSNSSSNSSSTSFGSPPPSHHEPANAGRPVENGFSNSSPEPSSHGFGSSSPSHSHGFSR